MDWWETCKIKARSNVEFIEPLPEESFQEEATDTRNPIQLDDVDFQLHDPNDNYVDELGDETNDDAEEELLTDQDTDGDEFNDNLNSETDFEDDYVGVGADHSAPTLVTPTHTPTPTSHTPLHTPSDAGYTADMVRCTTILREIFEKDLHPAGCAIRPVPLETKEFWWEMFQYANSHPGKLHRSVNEELWRAWTVEWEKPENKARSEQCSRNRKSERAGLGTGMSKHRGGARSNIDYTLDIERETGQKAKAHQVFVRTHMKDDGSWIDARSSTVNEEYERNLERARTSSQDASTEVDSDRVLFDIVGSHKGKIYDTGSFGKEFAAAKGFLRGSSSSTSSQSDRTQVESSRHSSRRRERSWRPPDKLRRRRGRSSSRSCSDMSILSDNVRCSAGSRRHLRSSAGIRRHFRRRLTPRWPRFMLVCSSEAARTTTLSKSWYSAWLTHPNLDLDERNFNGYRRDSKFEEFSKFANTIIQSFQQVGPYESVVLPPELFEAGNFIGISVDWCKIHNLGLDRKDTRSFGAIAGLTLAIVFTWRLLRAPRGNMSVAWLILDESSPEELQFFIVLTEIRRFYGMNHGGGYDAWRKMSSFFIATPFDFDKVESMRPKGHCVAVRVTIEDPDDGFKPTSGRVQELSFKSKPNVWAYFYVKSGGGIHESSDSRFGKF
ncbi:acetyl-coa carboxylase 1 [Phtheirospermum japonicum]|uniref:Acetyl-coa carboxylase 1 n=1 Tax=Phtheirospermum japonicum TaxID=374723 RepID=A0A830BCR6_9LAMI|nr:acetyl-coa carboxylase 1 [Phtheirospermum japonicum]